MGQHAVNQRAVGMTGTGVSKLPCRFVHNENLRIFIQNMQRQILG